MSQLLIEQSNQVVTLSEGSGAEKKMYIEGIFMQSEKKNRNGRIYPKNILENEVKRYNQNFVQSNQALGELNHPDRITVDPHQASHRIVEIEQNGSDFYGKALVLNTPCGNILKGLLEGGTKVGVSSRGRGSLKTTNGVNEVQSDFELSTVDVVLTPSAPDAYVQAIMEGADWIYGKDITTDKALEESKKRILAAKGPSLERIMIEEFTGFISTLKV